MRKKLLIFKIHWKILLRHWIFFISLLHLKIKKITAAQQQPCNAANGSTYKISIGGNKKIIVTYPEAIFEKVVLSKTLSENIISFKQGETINVDAIAFPVCDHGFTRTDFVYEPGSLLYVAAYLIFILLAMKNLTVLNYLEMKLTASAYLILKHS